MHLASKSDGDLGFLTRGFLGFAGVTELPGVLRQTCRAHQQRFQRRVDACTLVADLGEIMCLAEWHIVPRKPFMAFSCGMEQPPFTQDGAWKGRFEMRPGVKASARAHDRIDGGSQAVADLEET